MRMKQSALEKPNKKKSKGLSTWQIVLPITLILVVLHTMIAGSIVTISKASNGMTELTRTYSSYMSDATELQGGSSRLSELSFSFLLRPVQEDGELNVGPLIAYAGELKEPRRGADILKRFEDREIDDATMEKIAVAAACADAMVPIQLHAVALVFSVYPMPEIPALQELPLPALTAEEAAMTAGEKLDLVIDLLAGEEYSNSKKLVFQNVSETNASFARQLQAASAAQLKKVNAARAVMIATATSVVCVLLITFFLLIRLLIVPLRGFVRGIDEGTKISSHRGLAEVRLVARSYNSMMKRKDALENVLRAAAETDALTDLPNRYHLGQFLLQEEEEGVSAAVFLFDVNYLKETNDKEGHSAGDALLKRVAACLCAAFGDFPGAKCFRYGGDEFVAVVKNCSEADVSALLARFEEEQKTYNVSVAVGYAYTPDESSTPIKALFDEADEKMYENKKQTHDRDAR